MVHVDEIVRLVEADDESRSDAPLKTSSDFHDVLVRYRGWLSIVELLLVLYALSLLALGTHMCAAAGSPESLTSNPLARTAVATPAVWAFACLVAATSPPLLVMWLKGACGRHRQGKAHELGCLPDGLRALYHAFPLSALAFLLLTPATACAWGTPRVSAGSACLCDRIVATGGPLYQGVPADLTLAFVGDSAVAGGGEVLRLIRDENASAVVFNGDAAYMSQNRDWMGHFREHLGRTPFYFAAGSQPAESVRHVQEQAARHWHSMRECRGEVGLRSVCTHRGVGLLLSGVADSCGAVSRPRSTAFFEGALSEFAQRDVSWPICVFGFHSNRRDARAGAGQGPHAWDNYETCLKRGALIVSSHGKPASAHELASTAGAGVAPTASLPLEAPRRAPGTEAASTMRDGHSVAVFTGSGAGAGGGGSSEASHGAFFCRFHVRGDPRLARCFYKDVEGRTANDFYVRRPLAERAPGDGGVSFV